MVLNSSVENKAKQEMQEKRQAPDDVKPLPVMGKGRKEVIVSYAIIPIVSEIFFEIHNSPRVGLIHV